jgi:hypothetical protein
VHIFHDEKRNDFKSRGEVEYRIEKGEALPIRRAPYRIPFALKQEVDNQIQDTLNKDVIRPSSSPWPASVILVPKKSADE